jgi:hypothetical protein
VSRRQAFNTALDFVFNGGNVVLGLFPKRGKGNACE